GPRDPESTRWIEAVPNRETDVEFAFGLRKGDHHVERATAAHAVLDGDESGERAERFLEAARCRKEEDTMPLLHPELLRQRSSRVAGHEIAGETGDRSPPSAVSIALSLVSPRGYSHESTGRPFCADRLLSGGAAMRSLRRLFGLSLSGAFLLVGCGGS